MRKLFLLLSAVFLSLTSFAQLPFSESFDGTTFPPTGWTNTGTGTNTYGTGIVTWQRRGNGGFYNAPSPNTHTGAGMAGYESYWINYGGTAQLITPALNFTATGSKILSFWVYQDQQFSNDNIDVYVNTSASTTGAYLIANIAPVYYPATVGWAQFTYTLPATYNTATNYIIFKANSQYGVDLFLDDVLVINLAPCSGAPTAGTVSASPNPICPNKPTTLSAPNATVASGINYQWQSAATSTGPWTNIAGATTVPYTVSAGITATTYYRLKITCSSSGLVDSSNVITETLNPPSACYCIPTYSSGCIYGDDINTVTLTGVCGTSINQLNTGCSNNAYIYYNTLTPVVMFQNNSYSGTINSNYSSENIRMWIDFNDDGVFASTEQVGTVTSMSVNPSTGSYTLAIPAGANPGLHRMRYRSSWISPAAASIDPCIQYSYGETHDYDVMILSQTPSSPTVTNNGPVCPGSTLTITATTPYCSATYTLTGPGISSTTNGTGIFTIPNVSSTNGGVYSVTVTSGGFTGAAGTTTVTVYPTPTISIGTIVSPSTCGSSTGSLQVNGMTASTTYTLRYRKNGVQQTAATITSSSTGSYTINNLPAGSYDSLRVQTSNGCFSNMLGPITISDPNPPATPSLTYNTPICNGTTLCLNAASSGASYPSNAQYTFGGPAGYSSGPGTSNTSCRANMIAAWGGNYTVFVTVNGCTSATASANIPVTPPSAAPVPNNVSYCQNDIAVPLTAQGSNLLWYDSLTSLTPYASTPTPNTAIAGTRTYYVSQSAPCESPRAALTVTIKPKPNQPIVNPQSFSLCQYEVAQPLSNATGANLLWYATATGGTGSTTAPTPVTTIPGTYNFYVSQTVNGCESDRSIITVTIKPKPAPPVVVSPMRMCQYDNNGPLTAQGQNLKWYTTPTGGVGLSTAPVPNTNYEDSFFYYVTQTVNGCESDRAQIKVVVNYLPNGIIVRSRPWTCAEDTITFWYFGNARADAIYNWHIPPQATYVSGGGQGPYVVRLNTAGGALIDLQINNKGCLSTIIAQPVTVRELPVITFVASKQDACTDQVVNVALNSITSGIQSYSWQGFDGADITYGTATGGPYGVSWSQPGTHVITATALSNECTSHPAYDTISIHPYPDASIIWDNSKQTICSGDSLHLRVREGIDPASYLWTPKYYFYNNSDSSPVVIAHPRFSGMIGVRVTSIYGCAAQDSIMINAAPCCGVTFPTAFSPNNDGKNDIFRPITTGNHDVKTFRIINRWGQVVYESQNERAGWDGTFNGVPQDMGTYYFYYHYKCVDGQDLEEKGEFMLMR